MLLNCKCFLQPVRRSTRISWCSRRAWRTRCRCTRSAWSARRAWNARRARCTWNRKYSRRSVRIRIRIGCSIVITLRGFIICRCSSAAGEIIYGRTAIYSILARIRIVYRAVEMRYLIAYISHTHIWSIRSSGSHYITCNRTGRCSKESAFNTEFSNLMQAVSGLRLGSLDKIF